jgi:hypothetical protein
LLAGDVGLPPDLLCKVAVCGGLNRRVFVQPPRHALAGCGAEGSDGINTAAKPAFGTCHAFAEVFSKAAECRLFGCLRLFWCAAEDVVQELFLLGLHLLCPRRRPSGEAPDKNTVDALLRLSIQILYIFFPKLQVGAEQLPSPPLGATKLPRAALNERLVHFLLGGSVKVRDRARHVLTGRPLAVASWSRRPHVELAIFGSRHHDVVGVDVLVLTGDPLPHLTSRRVGTDGFGALRREFCPNLPAVTNDTDVFLTQFRVAFEDRLFQLSRLLTDCIAPTFDALLLSSCAWVHFGHGRVDVLLLGIREFVPTPTRACWSAGAVRLGAEVLRV